MLKSQNLCEYYFDSKVVRVSGDEKTVKTPHIYFERDLTTKALPYRLFAVFEEWLPEVDNDEAYDTVRIWYKRGETDCTNVCNNAANMREYKRQTNSDGTDKTRNVKKDGNILVIEKIVNMNPSGAGCIEAYKKEKCVAKFYFAANFAYRKKIFYTVDVVKKKNVTLRFRCKSAPENGIKVRLLGHETRLPCLNSDRDRYIIGESHELHFHNGAASISVPLPEHIINAGENARLFVVLEEECEAAFVLVTDVNETIPKCVQSAPLRPSYSCPFCHGPIDTPLAKVKAYRSGGGVACNEIANNAQPKSLEIKDELNRFKKRCLICKNDITNDDDVRAKIFPDAFLDHENFKIAFQGGPRAGKTTYISRFFGLKSILKESGKKKEEGEREPSDYNYDPSMQEMNYTLDRFGITAYPAKIKSVNIKTRKCLDISWEKKEMQYINRGMEIGRKLPSTPNGDYTEFPFMLEVNNKHYVSFYDIAGEDALTTSSYIEKIAANDEKTIGIFFIVTATNKDESVNKMVSDRLKDAGKGLDSTCPIAVILTKMDAIGDRFDSSCACRRFDYYPHKIMRRDFVYDGSDLEKFINISSEEIKSFIESEGGVDIEKEKKKAPDEKGFQNVKYFCISSFGFPESTYHDKGSIDDESYMRFVTSSRRMELPFIWMMRQFGIIK